MSDLTAVLLIVDAWVLNPGSVIVSEGTLRIAVKKWRHSAIISGPTTTATSLGNAPGATTRIYMIFKLTWTPSTFAIGASPGGIQEPAAQPGGIGIGIDPGVNRPASADGIPPKALLTAPSIPRCAILASIHELGRARWFACWFLLRSGLPPFALCRRENSA